MPLPTTRAPSALTTSTASPAAKAPSQATTPTGRSEVPDARPAPARPRASIRIRPSAGLAYRSHSLKADSRRSVGAKRVPT